MGRVRATAMVSIGALVAIALAALCLWRPALAAPISPFSDPHPELSAPRLPLSGRDAEHLSSRGGAREGLGDVQAMLAAPAAPTVTISPPAPTAVTPAPAASKPPGKIGLQAGHWRASEAPWPFNVQTGASGRGKTEAEVNLPIARAAAKTLQAAGYAVDVLPTIIPKGYKAMLVVAIHADGGPSSRRGYFVDTSFRGATSAAEAALARSIADAYGSVGIPYVFRGTQDSRYYYGYYSVDGGTPMVLIEAGFLTNPLDQQVLVDEPELAGSAIARGILAHLGR